jgi:hypothetical protein
MKLLRIARWIWEFPQCLLGFILTKIYDVDYSETYKGIDVYTGKFSGGISLGLYIIMDDDASENTKKHEWGHTRQSLRWGWLYLPIVGLTSIVWCTLHQYNKTLNKKDYDSIWPENMANKYGGL